MRAGKSVRLFLAEGSMGGLVTAEIMNWTGHILAVGRSGLRELLKRPEATRTGVYILIGEDADSLGGRKIYIGEGDDISTRLKDHESKKDFWDRVIVLTSKDSNLTKAHGRYLEARFISLARTAKRSEVTNANSGTTGIDNLLPEADLSDMEYYIEQAQIVLPVLQVDVFRSSDTLVEANPTEKTALEDVSDVVFVTGLKGQAWARAHEIDGEFTVMEGSRAKRWAGTVTAYRALQEKLINDGTLHADTDPNWLRFTHDQVFSSASAASATILGRNSNGKLEWKVEGTTTNYAEWLAQQAETG
ncbi:GIY-YIG nuclease family protein [Rhodococcus rhodochrous]|uniref:GIY-YIG nuclease family protein n=1 Tax=Rhodococcus rhodochrous TaxID=1829 RepID=A0AA47AGK5_RHORH|nr:GIY-YIG nuclease family protein [Rhodococcus rhodochrous]UZF48263.1 GIY-YIG nuclease family protein [Rhodococcus rhodochrous]